MQPPVGRGLDGGFHSAADLVSLHLSREGKAGWSTAGSHPQTLPHIAWQTFKFCLNQPHDVSCYVSRRILAAPTAHSAETHLPTNALTYERTYLRTHLPTNALTYERIYLRVHGFAHSSGMWRHPRLANVTCVCRWRLFGINPAITLFLLQCFLKYNVKGTRNYTFPDYRSHVFLIETCTSVIIK